MVETSKWIEIPRTFFAGGRTVPHLVIEERVSDLREVVTSSGATWAAVDLSGATDVSEAIDSIKGVLSFPEWCASSWDSIDDAFEEIRRRWTFPLMIAVDGLRPMVERQPHLGLNIVIHLNALSQAFSVAGDQLTVVYVADRWIEATD
ncbi:hypothetical protein [Sanguibacter sp. 25GB23B1]|uniref:barstar family protein n=1 Tax=unclassified Sanguibacter TaxID=2645534 RepID=UPI0032AEF3D4